MGNAYVIWDNELLEPFDETVSNGVSLSKILDAFIIENENASTIVAFLEQHDDLFDNIIHYSLHWPRLFQLDFMLQCKEHEIDYVVKKLPSISRRMAAYCCWQICKSESAASQDIKWKFREAIKQILETYNGSHPYHYWSASSVHDIDKHLFRACSKNRFLKAIGELSAEDFKTLMESPSSSLFEYRLCSVDVFQSLDDGMKKTFMDYAVSFNADAFIRFIFQFLDSEEDDETKCFLLDMLDGLVIVDTETSNRYHKHARSKSFSEMWLKMTIEGSFDTLEILKQLVLAKNWKVLDEWARKDSSSMDNVLKMSNVIQLKMSRDRKHKKAKHKCK